MTSKGDRMFVAVVAVVVVVALIGIVYPSKTNEIIFVHFTHIIAIFYLKITA